MPKLLMQVYAKYLLFFSGSGILAVDQGMEVTSPQYISLMSLSDRQHFKHAVATHHMSCVTPLGEVLRKPVLHVALLTLPHVVLPFADHLHLTSGPLQAGCDWPLSLIFSGPCLTTPCLNYTLLYY